jgi:large subunit ribosomal protein L46
MLSATVRRGMGTRPRAVTLANLRCASTVTSTSTVTSSLRATVNASKENNKHSPTTVWHCAAPTRLLTSSFATKAKKEDPAATTTIGYLAQKKAAKEQRREKYQIKQDRLERLVTRQSSKPRDEKKRAFRSWFVKKKVDEEFMNRKARQANLQWKMQVACIVERVQVVLPDKQEWETEYENLKTHLFKYGVQYPKELFNVDHDQIVAETDEELLELLPKGFTPAPRETEADETGDVRTTNRKLKTSIFLAVQDGEDKGLHWQLPTVTLNTDEMLLEAAKRAVKEKVGEEVEFWCPSNSPFAVDMMAFPEDQRKDGFYGTKTFFVKVQYDEGDVSEQTMAVKDFAWLERTEMVERVQKEQGDYESKFYQYML